MKVCVSVPLIINSINENLQKNSCCVFELQQKNSLNVKIYFGLPVLSS